MLRVAAAASCLIKENLLIKPKSSSSFSPPNSLDELPSSFSMRKSRLNLNRKKCLTITCSFQFVLLVSATPTRLSQGICRASSRHASKHFSSANILLRSQSKWKNFVEILKRCWNCRQSAPSSNRRFNLLLLRGMNWLKRIKLPTGQGRIRRINPTQETRFPAQ